MALDSFTPINPALLDYDLPPDEHGYPADLAAGDTHDVLFDLCGDASREFTNEMWIEPKDWDDWARENDKNKTWGTNYVDRFTNQQPTHECTCHSLIQNIAAAYSRHRAINYPDGPKANFRYEESGQACSVFLSPLSVYIEANPRQWGGASIRQVLEIAMRRGVLPDKIQPREDYGFEHTLHGTTGKGNSNQSRGPWVRLSQLPDGWEETAKHFKPKEVIFPKKWEEAVCLVLRGGLVSVGRKGHAIPWSRWLPREQAMAYNDSYDVVRYDSLATVKSAIQGAYMVASTTIPDTWSKPAG